MKLPLLSRLLRRRSVRLPGDSPALDTSVGRTTPLDSIDPTVPDRIISIEDTPELPAAPAPAPVHPRKSRKPPHTSWLRRAFNPALHLTPAAPVCLLARLESGTEVIYALGADGRAERVQEVPANCPLVLSATEDDLRLLLPEMLPYAVAKSRLIREVALYDKLSVAASGLMVYGTKVQRVAEFTARGQRLAPLVALADRLAMRQQDAVPTVTGFVFGDFDGDARETIAVFFAQLANSRIKTHIAISPDDLQSIYGAFIGGLGLPEDTEPLLFSQGEALAGLDGIYTAYPAQGDLLGVPAHLAWRGAVATSAVTCLAAVAWWWVATDELAAVRAEDARLRPLATQHADALGTLVAANLSGFSKFMGLDPNIGLADAEALFLPDLPGTRVVSEATIQARIHEVFAPIHTRGDTTEEPDPRALAAALALTRTGCQRTSLEYSGGLNEIRIRFLCPSGNDVAAAFRS